jgi:hypothetical protein
MNDAEALAEINAALALWFKGEADEFTVLARIAQITGLNAGTQ